MRYACVDGGGGAAAVLWLGCRRVVIFKYRYSGSPAHTSASERAAEAACLPAPALVCLPVDCSHVLLCLFGVSETSVAVSRTRL